MRLALLVCIFFFIIYKVAKCVDYYYPQYELDSKEETENYEIASEAELDEVCDICRAQFTPGCPINLHQANFKTRMMDAAVLPPAPLYLPFSLSSDDALPQLENPQTWGWFHFYVDINMPSDMRKEIRRALSLMEHFVPCIDIREYSRLMDLYDTEYNRFGAIFFYSKTGECSSELGHKGTIGPKHSLQEVHLAPQCAASKTLNAYVFRILGYVWILVSADSESGKSHPPCWSHFDINEYNVIHLRELYNCYKCPLDTTTFEFGIPKYNFEVPCGIGPPPTTTENPLECEKLKRELIIALPGSREYQKILEKIFYTKNCGIPL